MKYCLGVKWMMRCVCELNASITACESVCMVTVLCRGKTARAVKRAIVSARVEDGQNCIDDLKRISLEELSTIINP